MSPEPPLRNEAMLIWDMIVPLMPSVGNDIALLSRYRRAGYTYVSLTIAGDDCDLSEAMHRLAAAKSEIARCSTDLRLALGIADVLRAQEEGQLAVGLHLEGTECLERDPNLIDVFYSLGIRHAILAFNQSNSAAGGCAEGEDVGLTRLGRRFLDRMTSVGMLVDLSHMSRKSSLQAIEHVAKPVVFTHSNARALHNHYRNITDEQATACAEVGGLIGISGSKMYTGEFPTLADGMFRHLDYMVQLVGPDHVGLGIDYVADTQALLRYLSDRPDEWPDAASTNVQSVEYLAPEDVWTVVSRMDSAGYPASAIRKILGENYIRIASEIWQ